MALRAWPEVEVGVPQQPEPAVWDTLESDGLTFGVPNPRVVAAAEQHKVVGRQPVQEGHRLVQHVRRHRWWPLEESPSSVT